MKRENRNSLAIGLARYASRSGEVIVGRGTVSKSRKKRRSLDKINPPTGISDSPFYLVLPVYHTSMLILFIKSILRPSRYPTYIDIIAAMYLNKIINGRSRL